MGQKSVFDIPHKKKPSASNTLQNEWFRIQNNNNNISKIKTLTTIIFLHDEM